MKNRRIFARILMVLLMLVPVVAQAAGPEVPAPPKGGTGILDFLMNLFAAIFAFLQNLFGSLPGIPG
jgi:hypothetical protein